MNNFSETFLKCAFDHLLDNFILTLVKIIKFNNGAVHTIITSATFLPGSHNILIHFVSVAFQPHMLSGMPVVQLCNE